jgi:predicted AAA+ superfamily ATPase
MDYRARIVDRELASRLTSAGAVVIEGPKACGKTSTARQFAASEVLLDVDRNARQAVAIDPALVLEGDTPRLIDEWQTAPVIWDHIRRAIDDRARPGQFLLTGSAVPADEVTRHTGAGRLARLRMRPMTLCETGHANGTVSLQRLLQGEPPRCPDPGLELLDLVECIVSGGWPGFLDYAPPQAQQAVQDYLEEIRRVDIRRVDGIHRDPEKVGRMLRSLARNISTPAAATTLAADAGGADGTLNDDTVREYLTALERLMIVEDLPAWAPHLRSRSILRSAPKRHFADPSLAVAALRATPERLLKELNLLGLLFESLVVRDLRVHAQAAGAAVYHYRDNTGLEIDAIVEEPGGRWGAFEVKLGTGQIEEAASSLQKLLERVDTERCGVPSFRAVVVGAGFGYVREDGIAVLPIGALGP